jgi:hypothetical protein
MRSPQRPFPGFFVGYGAAGIIGIGLACMISSVLVSAPILFIFGTGVFVIGLIVSLAWYARYRET